MGLAAVPFGTAQVHGNPVEYKVKVIKKEMGTDWHFFIESVCLSGTELEQDYARLDIIFSKCKNIKPRVSISSSVDTCRCFFC